MKILSLLKTVATFSITAVMLLYNSPLVRAEGEAVSITKAATFTVGDTPIAALGDEQLSTRHKLSEDQTILVKSDTPIHYVYMLFNRPPQKWSLQYQTQQKPQGTYGFMHELIRLDSPQTVLSLSLLKGTELCDIILYGEGTLPSSVQQWQPPLEDADMLLLPTHSDDEHVFFGGIMPYYAGELGKKVQVAYLNNHYGEWYRPHELLGGLWEVGITNYPIVPDEFRDQYSESLEHAKTLYDTDAMLAYQVELLRRFKPEVVIGHDLNGEYGHGVHMLNANLLTQAVELSEDATKYPESVEKYGTFDVPKTYLHLYGENQIEIDIDRPLNRFHGKTAYEVSVAGFAHHQSQQQYFEVNKGGQYDCRKYGLYRSTVGDDMVGLSLFENIIATSNIPPLSSLPASEPISSSGTASSAPASDVSEATSSVSSDDKSNSTSGLDILKGLGPKLIVILGVLVILVTLILQNKRKSQRIEHYNKVRQSAKDKKWEP